MDVLWFLLALCALFILAVHELNQKRKEDEEIAREAENAYYDAISRIDNKDPDE